MFRHSLHLVNVLERLFSVLRIEGNSDMKHKAGQIHHLKKHCYSIYIDVEQTLLMIHNRFFFRMNPLVFLNPTCAKQPAALRFHYILYTFIQRITHKQKLQLIGVSCKNKEMFTSYPTKITHTSLYITYNILLCLSCKRSRWS